jgi:hypothetical protein
MPAKKKKTGELVEKKEDQAKKTLSAKEVIELAGNDEATFDTEPEELIEPDSTLLTQQEEDLEDISIRDHSIAFIFARDWSGQAA